MRASPALLKSSLIVLCLIIAGATHSQTFRRGYLGAAYSLGVAQEPLSAGLRAKSRGVLLEGGYLQNIGNRWLVCGDLYYQSLNGHMDGIGDLSYYDQKASQEQRFGLSYDELSAKALGLQASAGYYLLDGQANWRPWLGLGLGFSGTSFVYLHPITNTRVYVTHLRPAIVSSAGLMGVSGKLYFDLRLDAMPASLLTKRIKTNTVSEKATGPDFIGPTAGRFEAGVSTRLGKHFLAGVMASGQHRYAGDDHGGYLALSFGIRLGYQIGSWGTPRIRSPKVKKEKDTAEEKEAGNEAEEGEKTE